MKWIRDIAVLPLFILPLLALQGGVRTDSQKAAEAQALLDKAEKLSRLTEKGSPPFALEATVERGTGNKKKTASFYLLWQDAEHWRAMAVEGDHREIHVRNPEGMWQPKFPDPELIRVFSDVMTFPFKRRVAPWNDVKIEGVRDRKINNIALSCVRLRVSPQEPELCFNSAGLLTRVVWSGTAFPDTVVEYDRYVKFGEKWVPQEIRWKSGGQLRSEVHVGKLVASPQATDALFTKPPENEAWPDCDTYGNAQPIYSGPLNAPNVVLRGTADLRPADSMLLVISPDGTVQEVRFMNPPGQASKNWADVFTQMRYRPATCDGKPVLGYLLLPFSSSH